MGWVKICGVTSLEDASMCVRAGADAIGVNFWSGSPRRCEPSVAAEIQREVRAEVIVVAVVVNEDVVGVRELLKRTGVSWVQFHGDEGPETVRAFLPNAYKALPVRSEAIAEEARAYPGDRVLLDSARGPLPGGSGKAFDWKLAASVARERSVVLAGGLDANNVARAIAEARPFGVDVASGVEGASPGRKDRGKVEAFVQAARAAWRERQDLGRDA